MMDLMYLLDVRDGDRLAEIENREDTYCEYGYHTPDKDVQWLIAEVKRLRAALGPSVRESTPAAEG